MMEKSESNRLLGYPPERRLLIINADDFGMCHATNAAIMRLLEAGAVPSTTLMAPCPWAAHAMRFLKDHPEIPFGVHLTAICDTEAYPWRPLSSREEVPSLIDEAGNFYTFGQMSKYLAQVKLDQLEMEFKAQVETVLATGLKPTHLDWHALRIGGRADIFDLMTGLAQEYGLALRIMGRSVIEKLQSQGLPTIDYDFLDSYLLDPLDKPAQYARLLHELPEGLSEWAVHPGLDSPELLAIEPGGNHIRQADYDFWSSPQAKELVEKEGIILMDYRALQAVWQEINRGLLNGRNPRER